MDPNANLEEQRSIIDKLRDGDLGPLDALDRMNALERLADLAEAMDDWMTAGGFMPRGWAERRP